MGAYATDYYKGGDKIDLRIVGIPKNVGHVEPVQRVGMVVSMGYPVEELFILMNAGRQIIIRNSGLRQSSPVFVAHRADAVECHGQLETLQERIALQAVLPGD